MKLIPCAGCGRGLSPRATVCPGCGQDPTRAQPRRSRRVWYLTAGIVVVLAGGVTAALAIPRSRPTATIATPSPDAAIPRDIRAEWRGPRPFDGCAKSGAQRVAVTYVTTKRPLAPGDDLRSWFPGVDPRHVHVWFLERKDGYRLVAFELSRQSWPDWQTISGDALGDEVCWRIGAALVDRGIGRRDRGRLDASAEKYEFDIFERRSASYVRDHDMGDLGSFLRADGLARIDRWLAGRD